MTTHSRFLFTIAATLVLSGAAMLAQDKPKAAKPAPKVPPAPFDKLVDLTPEAVAKIEAAIPAKAAATPKCARHVLVFWRCEGFPHKEGISYSVKALELMGQKTGAYTTEVSRDYSVFNPDQIKKYDAIILDSTTKLKLSDEQKKAILDFVHAGKGLVGIHAASDNFYDWPEGAALVGGLFDGHPWTAGGTWAFKLDEPDHVLVRAFGGKGFHLKDEIYQYKAPYTRADRRVLVNLDLSDPDTGAKQSKRADKDYAVVWIKTYGQGRVFFNGFGHNGSVFQDPAMLQFYLDGIQYALGDLEADATPKK